MRDGNVGVRSSGTSAEADFRRAVEDIFGSRCKAAWLSGSFLYRGAEPGRSDIDVVVVLDEATSLPADEETLERIRAFVLSYLDIHAREELDPDLDFPTEYVVPATLEQAIAWRGFAAGGAMIDQFPPVESSDYWLGRPDRWFHAWVSMTAFSRFLAGERDYHERMKLAAWKAIVRFLLLRSNGSAVGSDQIWQGLAQFGAKPTYHDFWSIEGDWIERALAELEAEGSLYRSGDRAIPVMPRLRQWEGRIEAAIQSDDGNPPLLLPPGQHRRIGAHAAKSWTEKESILIPS